VVVWPTFATTAKSPFVKRAQAKAVKAAGSRARAVVVVPNESEFQSLTQTSANPAIIKLEDLEEALNAGQIVDVRASGGSPG
jgi:hypothetical protein